MVKRCFVCTTFYFKQFKLRLPSFQSKYCVTIKKIWLIGDFYLRHYSRIHNAMLLHITQHSLNSHRHRGKNIINNSFDSSTNTEYFFEMFESGSKFLIAVISKSIRPIKPQRHIAANRKLIYHLTVQITLFHQRNKILHYSQTRNFQICSFFSVVSYGKD